MNSLKQKVAYLHGLTRGLDVKGSSSEGKVIIGILDVLDSIAEEVEDLYVSQQDLESYVDSIDEDLEHLEEVVYEEEIYDEDEYVELNCPACNEAVEVPVELMETEEDIEVTCPVCGETMFDDICDNSNHRRKYDPGI